jgi:hypothetical protein
MRLTDEVAWLAEGKGDRGRPRSQRIAERLGVD